MTKHDGFNFNVQSKLRISSRSRSIVHFAKIKKKKTRKTVDSRPDTRSIHLWKPEEGKNQGKFPTTSEALDFFFFSEGGGEVDLYLES